MAHLNQQKFGCFFTFSASPPRSSCESFHFPNSLAGITLETALIVSSRVVSEAICSRKCRPRALPPHDFSTLFPFQHRFFQGGLRAGNPHSSPRVDSEGLLKNKKKADEMKAAGTWQLAVG